MEMVRTQPFLQSLDISALGTAFPPNLIVCTVMSQPLARATPRPVPVAPELPLSTDHTCQTFGLGHIGIVWRVCRGRIRLSVVNTIGVYGHGIACFLDAIHGRVHVRGSGHGGDVTFRPARWGRHRDPRSVLLNCPEQCREISRSRFEDEVRYEREGTVGTGSEGGEGQSLAFVLSIYVS